MPFKIVIFVVNFLVVSAQFEKVIPSKNGENKDWVKLVAVGNKIYFPYYNIGRNWEEAELWCKEKGMKIATVKTEAEAEFLNSKYEPGLFYGWYRLALRDAQEPRAMSWDNTDEMPTNLDSLNWTWFPQDKYTLCGYYLASSRPTFGIDDCDTLTKTLCEDLF